MSTFSKGLLIVELCASALVWPLLLAYLLFALGGGLSATQYEQTALLVGVVANFPIVFLGLGFLRSSKGSFSFSLNLPWLALFAGLLLVIGLTVVNHIARPESSYNAMLVTGLALLVIPTAHLLILSVATRLSNTSLERTREG